MKMSKEYLAGERFGKLVIVSFAGRDRHSHKIYKCLCECGIIKNITYYNLLNGTKSCGCINRKNLVNKKFGKLTVLSFSHVGNTRKIYWNCVCECGNEKNVNTYSLTSGDIKSCGCAQYSQERVEKSKQTCLNKYGVDNPSKNKDIRLKAAKSSNNSFVLHHWKTNKELICQGSWERKCVMLLNNKQINFEWQPNIFTLDDGRTYTPDLFIVDENKWIEIKGYFYDDAEEKWDWFHKKYPNSELWNKKKLKELNIL